MVVSYGHELTFRVCNLAPNGLLLMGIVEINSDSNDLFFWEGSC